MVLEANSLILRYHQGRFLLQTLKEKLSYACSLASGAGNPWQSWPCWPITMISVLIGTRPSLFHCICSSPAFYKGHWPLDLELSINPGWDHTEIFNDIGKDHFPPTVSRGENLAMSFWGTLFYLLHTRFSQNFYGSIALNTTQGS